MSKRGRGRSKFGVAGHAIQRPSLSQCFIVQSLAGEGQSPPQAACYPCSVSPINSELSKSEVHVHFETNLFIDLYK
jgi:hypothetical protein